MGIKKQERERKSRKGILSGLSAWEEMPDVESLEGTSISKMKKELKRKEKAKAEKARAKKPARRKK